MPLYQEIIVQSLSKYVDVVKVCLKTEACAKLLFFGTPYRVTWSAVFDGHAGKQVARLASSCLHTNAVASGLLDAEHFQVRIQNFLFAMTALSTKKSVLTPCVHTEISL